MVLSVALFFTGCEKGDSNGRMPDNIQDSNVGVVKLAPTSDFLIDRNDFAGFNFDITVDELFDVPFQKITLMGVYNGDTENAVMVKEVTSVPETVSLKTEDLVNLFDAIPVQDSIKIGDSFDFYTDITLTNGQTIPAYLADGTNTAASSTRNIMSILKNGYVSLHLPVPCPFVPDEFTGDAVDVLEHWNDNSGDAFYPATVSINQDLSNGDTLVYEFVGLFTGDNTSTYSLLVNKKTYQIYEPDPGNMIVVNEDLFGWGYGRLWFDNFTEPLLGTCEKYIRFTVTPDLNDAGVWFGSTVTYYVGPGAGDVTFGKKDAGIQEKGYGVLRDRVVTK